MRNTLTADGTVEDAEQMQAALAELIEKIKGIREEIASDDREIARLKSERALLRLETHTLRDETRAILANFWKHE